ncbi:MAG: hypothetical protein ICV66_07090, partial [Chitinophagaceae bacterium]|nr:hypothetical protein [Chitinophagaceae bacterium]
DELVLQFGYDKISYASALLLLEITATSQAFAVAATGKKHLLSRIEKIVGIKKRRALNFKQIAGLLAAAFLFLLVNSIILIKSTINKDSIVFSPLSNLVFLFNQEDEADEPEIGSQKIQKRVTSPATTGHAASVAAGKVHLKVHLQQIAAEENEEDEVNDIIPVAFDEADAKLTEDEKEQVKSTVATTKKVLGTYQWKEIENSIADGMTQTEKQFAQQQYLTEVEKINWKNLEKKLKSSYENIDWDCINSNLNAAMKKLQLDSLQKSYSTIVTQIEKLQKSIVEQQTLLAFPDISAKELQQIKTELQNRINIIKLTRTRKVIEL